MSKIEVSKNYWRRKILDYDIFIRIKAKSLDFRVFQTVPFHITFERI